VRKKSLPAFCRQAIDDHSLTFKVSQGIFEQFFFRGVGKVPYIELDKPVKIALEAASSSQIRRHSPGDPDSFNGLDAHQVIDMSPGALSIPPCVFKSFAGPRNCVCDNLPLWAVRSRGVGEQLTQGFMWRRRPLCS
jgi:hypothetical protein